MTSLSGGASRPVNATSPSTMKSSPGETTTATVNAMVIAVAVVKR